MNVEPFQDHSQHPATDGQEQQNDAASKENARQNVLRGLMLLETATRTIRHALAQLWSAESGDQVSVDQPLQSP
jgi:hypothetical protein